MEPTAPMDAPTSATTTGRSNTTNGAGGVVDTCLNTSLGLADKSLTTSFKLMRLARSETKQRYDALLDLVDSSQQSLIRFARTVGDSVDDVVAEGIDGSEQAARSVLEALRGAGQGSSELASRTVSSIIGGDSRPRASA